MSRRTAPESAEGRAIYERRELVRIARRWDRRAGTWDTEVREFACHLNEDRAYDRFLEEARRRILRKPAFCRTHGVIDLGCGTGLVLEQVLPFFAWGLGIDLSPRMVRAATRKGIERARFLTGDAFSLPTLSPKAGAVLSRGILLSHYGSKNACALLRAARIALVDRGFLIFDFLNEAARLSSEHAPGNKTYYTAAEMRAIGRKAGFAKIDISGGVKRRVLLLIAQRG